MVEVNLFLLEASTQTLPGCSIQPGYPDQIGLNFLPYCLIPTNVYWYRSPMGDWPEEFDNIDKDDNLHACVVFFGSEGGLNMHRAGNNVLFADDHVAVFKKFDPQALTFHPTEMKDWDQVERAN